MSWFRRKITDKRLMYSATERCTCGAGLAYTKHMDHWDCSDVIKGEQLPGTHHIDPIPFSARHITLESQHSANGETTRPATIKEIMAALKEFDNQSRG